MGYYRTAQICINGHCITDAYDAYPQHRQAFCDKCGAATITSCPSCHANIRGAYHEPDICVLGGRYNVPAYCYSCGKPYPWTQAAIEAATALVEEEESLSQAEQTRLVEVLPDIITETPKTQLAIVRFKKALLSAGKFTADGLRQFAIDFGCELAKKQLGL